MRAGRPAMRVAGVGGDRRPFILCFFGGAILENGVDSIERRIVEDCRCFGRGRADGTPACDRLKRPHIPDDNAHKYNQRYAE